MQSSATTVEEYLASLPADRRADLSAVREVVLANLPPGIVETMNWGMIAYEVPLSTYPTTYNGQPLAFAGLASQKNHMSVYLSSVYGSEPLRVRFEEEYRATGKRLDMGKSCVRFRRLDNLPLDVIGRAIAAVDVAGFIAQYEDAQTSHKRRPAR